jgi:hypothetical protein
MLQNLQVGIIPAVDTVAHTCLLLARQLPRRYRACDAFLETGLG